MTSVHFCRDGRGRLCGVSAVGHAGQAAQGEDIVCAGVSAILTSSVNALEQVAGVPVNPREGEGFLSVRLPRGLSAQRAHDARVILRTARLGLSEIAAAYPRYLRVT